MIEQRRPQLNTRLRSQISLFERRPIRRGNLRRSLLANHAGTQPQAQRGIAQRAGHIKNISGPASAAPQHSPGRDTPDGHDRHRERRVRSAVGITTGKRDPEAFLGITQSGGEAIHPRPLRHLPKRQRKQIGDRLRTLGRNIRDIHRQHFPGDIVRCIAGQEVDAFGNRIRVQDEIVAGFRS